MPFSTKIKL